MRFFSRFKISLKKIDFFRENRFVYEKDSLDKALEAGAKVLDTGADLLKTAADALAWGVEKTKLGIVYTANGIKEFVDWARDPGKPDDYLPIYKDLTQGFIPESVPDGGLTGDDKLDAALRSHGRLQFLNFQTAMYVELTRPAMEEYKNVDDRIGLIQANRFSMGSTIDKYDEKIRAINKTLDQGLFKTGSLQDVQLRTEKRQLEADKYYFESLCSYKVKWRKPEVQEVEFPPKSGKYVKRFVPSDKEEVEVDLRQLKFYLAGFTRGYKGELSLYSYEKEKDKLQWHRDKLVKQFIDENEVFLGVQFMPPNIKYDKYESTIKALDVSASGITGRINFPSIAGKTKPVVLDSSEVKTKVFQKTNLKLKDIKDALNR